ncbi:MAG TPA: 2Fe-2S iron-sulfur cluster-binding protein [Pyrinomonadaceae bacterium]|jgi:ferredoxin|nr:2Fe-2S iron-sulfur cluster-binding protein [Pyrinomonadaceae bacterium]
MGVNLEWKAEGEGRSGVVAEGTYLWAAVKRIGVRLPAECDGRGQCDTCAVIVSEGATLLSGLTDAERKILSPERLAAGERLACQAKIEHGGDVVLRPVPVTERAETAEEAARDLREEFRRMPLRKKFATLVGIEADMAYETLVRAADIPFDIFGKGLELLAGRGRRLAQNERAARRPADEKKSDAPGGGAGEGSPESSAS